MGYANHVTILPCYKCVYIYYEIFLFFQEIEIKILVFSLLEDKKYLINDDVLLLHL